ncbi:MAG: 50S ribosomal protein L32 [Candidatus Ancaeobacter aquaticus]|nr:50S ribosomal protein L32 [Candidatus Ancaeobacter aquaticus]
MAVPKRRQSNTRGRKRRTHYKMEAPGISTCSHCGQTKLPHHVCNSCGYYGEKQIDEIKA